MKSTELEDAYLKHCAVIIRQCIPYQSILNHFFCKKDEALRLKDNQLSLVAETELFLRLALARVEEKIKNERCEIEHLRAHFAVMFR